MTYEDWSSFAQTWGVVYFVAIFAVAVTYALWPSKAKEFRNAARFPMNEEKNGDDRPLA
jgi:cytochrome c oxidase cbb3-type subunit 4